MPIVWKKSGVMMRRRLGTRFFMSNGRPSSGSKPLVLPPGPIAANELSAACETPGMAAVSAAMRSKVPTIRDGSP